MKSERKCLECGEVLHGRADQKFCSDQCRNAFNNKQLGISNSTIRRINRILRKNQAVLAALNTRGKMTVSESDLIKEGFNFNYVTNLFTTHQGRTYYFCYDQGYSMVDGDKVLLVRKKEYVS
jgi:predicted nucleic acid-binding Zn ribbon protein